MSVNSITTRYVYCTTEIVTTILHTRATVIAQVQVKKKFISIKLNILSRTVNEKIKTVSNCASNIANIQATKRLELSALYDYNMLIKIAFNLNYTKACIIRIRPGERLKEFWSTEFRYFGDRLKHTNHI